MNLLLKQNPGIIVPPTAKLHDAMLAMTQARLGIILIVDARRRLLGVLTDIDIRRALLKSQRMDVPVSKVMTSRPVTVTADMSQADIAEVFSRTPHAYIPVVGEGGRLVGLVTLTDYATIPKRHPNWIVVMAGGMGKRLLPLTESVPKPMVRVGDKPILELLLEQLIASGFGRFILTVNHMADQIKDYCGDGSRWGAQIEYIQEKGPLGTAGALSLIKRDLGGTFLVVNGDILTKVNFGALLHFHKTEKALATLCIKQHEVQIPYGVIELKNHKLEKIVEKPTQRFFVNAGIYALEPEALSLLPKGKARNMPDFLEDIRRRKPRSVSCFPLQEYWQDIGRPQDHERASLDYDEEFKSR